MFPFYSINIFNITYIYFGMCSITQVGVCVPPLQAVPGRVPSYTCYLFCLFFKVGNCILNTAMIMRKVQN